MENDEPETRNLAENSKSPSRQINTSYSPKEGSSHQLTQRLFPGEPDNDEPQWKSHTDVTSCSGDSSEVWETARVDILDEAERVYLEGDSSGLERSTSPAYHYESDPETSLLSSPGAEIDEPETMPENIMLNKQGSNHWHSSRDFFHGEPLPKLSKHSPENLSQQQELDHQASHSRRPSEIDQRKTPETKRKIAILRRIIDKPSHSSQPELSADKSKNLYLVKRPPSTSHPQHSSSQGPLLDITNKLTASTSSNERQPSSIQFIGNDASGRKVFLQKHSQTTDLQSGALHKVESNDVNSDFKKPPKVTVLKLITEDKADDVSQFICRKGCEELKFETWWRLYEHYLHRHNQCSCCYDMTCDSLFHLTKKGEHSCRYCIEVFKHKGTLAQHIWFHPPSKPHYCHFCQKHFTNLVYDHKERCLYAYLSTLLKATFKCKECSLNMRGFDHHYTHCIRNHQQYICRCCVGTQPFRTLTDLQSHIDNTHFRCKYCLYRIFYIKRTFQAHVREDHAGPPFECTTCEESFQTLEELETHVVSQSTVFEPLVIHCRWCKITFTEPRKFLEHRRNLSHQRKIAAIAQNNCLL